VGGNFLSKAKRGKRRWLGLQISPEIGGREDFKQMMESLTSIPDTWRLYDLQVGLEPNTGLAIIRVPLTDYPTFREVLGGQGDTALNQGGDSGVKSLTSSGKIKLVRQRLGLERPKHVRKTK